MNTITKRKLWIGGALCLVVAGLIVGAMRPKRVSGAPSASPDVEVVQVEQKDVPIFGEWIGTLDGFTNADVRAQVTGYLLRQGYQEGRFVKKGQLLFEIDPRPFQAALDQAEGQLAQAKANLDFTRLIAPIDGIAGQAQLQVGALVNPNSGPVTSVSTLDPIKVYFTVSEREYLDWNKRFPTETTRQAADKSLRLELILADGSPYLHEGTFYFADRQVNQSTGAIRIAALFPNPGNILRPGGYGKVR